MLHALTRVSSLTKFPRFSPGKETHSFRTGSASPIITSARRMRGFILAESALLSLRISGIRDQAGLHIIVILAQSPSAKRRAYNLLTIASSFMAATVIRDVTLGTQCHRL